MFKKTFFTWSFQVQEKPLVLGHLHYPLSSHPCVAVVRSWSERSQQVRCIWAGKEDLLPEIGSRWVGAQDVPPLRRTWHLLDLSMGLGVPSHTPEVLSG